MRGIVPWEKKILFEKEIGRSVDDQLCLTVAHRVVGAYLVKDGGRFVKWKKEVGKKFIF
jgi:hypothetical protein